MSLSRKYLFSRGSMNETTGVITEKTVFSDKSKFFYSNAKNAHLEFFTEMLQKLTSVDSRYRRKKLKE